MIQGDLQDARRGAREYLAGNSPHPFFISADSGEAYSSIVIEYSSYRALRASDYCHDDSYPDTDRLLSDIKKLDSDAVLLGVGESVSLGCSSSILTSLIDLTLPHKLIVLCRGAKEYIRHQSSIDRKFNKRRYSVIRSNLDLNVLRVSPDIPCDAISGFRALLRELENGATGDIRAKSSLPLRSAQVIESCYTLLVEEGRIAQGYESALPDELWRQYLEDDSLENDDITHWRSYLRMLMQGTNSPYLSLVMRRSSSYEEYGKELYRAILHVPYSSSSFSELYDERKRLLRTGSIQEMADFVTVAAAKGADRIHYLTDLTTREQYAVVEDIIKAQAVPDDLARIYPALHDYLARYVFSCANGSLFTSYFEHYKLCKLMNVISPSFLGEVVELARDGNRPYNMLDTRNSVVESLNQGVAKLYWVDALGVEFLSYIQKLAEKRGLSMATHVTRASLPTLTCFNKGFYEDWDERRRWSTKQLDSLIHEGEETYNYSSEKLPLHIVKELEIIAGVLDQISADLASRSIASAILTSDHGASRLAVINEKENRWEMQTKGVHSGRCCPISDIDERPDCAIEGNGYWALANYDRFRGGRKASVEVHGGASLEEVVVPVIVLRLRDESIEIIGETEVAFTSYRVKPEVRFFCAAQLHDVTARMKDNVYPVVHIGDGHFSVTLADIRKPGSYMVDIYDGDDCIGSISFKVESQAARSNDDDFFF